jgi:hypothetical protein
VTTAPGVATPPKIRDGRLFGFFAFDAADAIELEAIPGVLRPERARIAPRRAPESVRWAAPPAEIPIGERTLATPDGQLRAEVSARLFDFGAVSVGMAVPLAGDLAALSRLSESLAASDAVGVARSVLHEVTAEIRPALRGAGFEEFVEDYWVFQVAALEPALAAETLLAEQRALLAAILSQDAAPLSRPQVDETLREPLSYSPNDLVLADWSAAFVYDTGARTRSRCSSSGTCSCSSCACSTRASTARAGACRARCIAQTRSGAPSAAGTARRSTRSRSSPSRRSPSRSAWRTR